MRAQVRWLDVIHWRADGVHFPSLSGLRPLAGVKLVDFAITFAIPTVELA